VTESRRKRLAKLELNRRPAAEVLIVWWDREKETQAQAIARRFPDGAPPGVRLIIIS
jgi:hypothetical protein